MLYLLTYFTLVTYNKTKLIDNNHAKDFPRFLLFRKAILTTPSNISEESSKKELRVLIGIELFCN